MVRLRIGMMIVMVILSLVIMMRWIQSLLVRRIWISWLRAFQKLSQKKALKESKTNHVHSSPKSLEKMYLMVYCFRRFSPIVAGAMTVPAVASPGPRAPAAAVPAAPAAPAAPAPAAPPPVVTVWRRENRGEERRGGRGWPWPAATSRESRAWKEKV